MIETERLVLKPYSEGDRDDMLALLKDESIKRTFMIPDFKTEAEAVAAWEKLLRYSISGERYERGMYLDGRMIGFLNEVETDGGSIEIGYVVHPGFHNKGYATEAFRAVIQDLFHDGYTEVVAGAFAYNTASRRVMEKCGMRLTDKVEQIEYHGRMHECVYYAITNA